MHVCGSASELISTTTCPNFPTFLPMLPVSVAQSSSGSVAIRSKWRNADVQYVASIGLHTTMHSPTPPAAWCWLHPAWAPKIDKSIVQGVSGMKTAMHYCAVTSANRNAGETP